MLPVAERALTELHAAAVAAFLRKTGLSRTSLDVIGFHGHTVLHRPEDHLSVQIGDGPLLAELAQVDVVYDLRAADLAAGGRARRSCRSTTARCSAAVPSGRSRCSTSAASPT